MGKLSLLRKTQKSGPPPPAQADWGRNTDWGRNSWLRVKGLLLWPQSMNLRILFLCDCSCGTLRLGAGPFSGLGTGLSKLPRGGEDLGPRFSPICLATDALRLLQCMCVYLCMCLRVSACVLYGPGGFPDADSHGPRFRWPGSAAAEWEGKERRQRDPEFSSCGLPQPPSCSFQPVKWTQYRTSVFLGGGGRGVAGRERGSGGGAATCQTLIV